MTAKKTKFKTKGEARVTIAKDVLKWIKAENMVVASGQYVSATDLIREADIKENSDLRTLLQNKKEKEPCTVCALGAAFLTAVDRFNEVGCGDLVDIGEFTAMAEYSLSGGRSIPGFNQKAIHKYLKKFFTPLQMDMIECAFERTVSHATTHNKLKNFKTLQRAVNYGCKHKDIWSIPYEDPSDRLTRIMKNIIKNKGTFVPGGKYDS